MREKLKKRNLKRILKGINMGRNQRDEGGLRMTAATIQASATGAGEIADSIANNGTQAVTISSVAPAPVGTATIAKWLQIQVDGVGHYIPLWT